MKPTGFEYLSVEDAAVILELTPKYNITLAKRLTKGSDWKFYVETAQGDKCSLVVGIKDEEKLYFLKEHPRRLNYIAAAGVNIHRSVDCGILNNGKLIYHLITWIDGNDLVDVLPYLSPNLAPHLMRSSTLNNENKRNCSIN